MYKIRGTIKNINTEEITSKSGDIYKKMLITVEELDTGFHHTHQFEIFGEDNIKKNNDNIREGWICEIDFYIKSNEWKGKYFNSLNIKSIKVENNLDNPF